MKFIREYSDHLDRLKIGDIHYIVETDEEYDILIDLMEEGLFSRLGNWMFKAPKIRKLVRQANIKKMEAAQVENEQREKIQKIIDSDEYVDIQALAAVLKKKMVALNNIADEFSKEAQAIAGTNTYLNKVKRIEELKGIMEINDYKYKNATEEEKWTYDNFAKKAKPIIRTEQADVDGAAKGRSETETMSPEKRVAMKNLEKLIDVEPDAYSAFLNFTRSYVANKLGERKTDRTANINRQVVDSVSKISNEFKVSVNDAFDIYSYMYKNLNPKKKELDAESAYLCLTVYKELENKLYDEVDMRNEIIDTMKLIRFLGLNKDFPNRPLDSTEIDIAHQMYILKNDMGLDDNTEVFKKWIEINPENEFFTEEDMEGFPKEYNPKNDRDFAKEAEEEAKRLEKKKQF